MTEKGMPSVATRVSAWVATLLASLLPTIIARELLGVDSLWVVGASAIIVAAAWALANRTSALRPIRGYLLLLVFVLVLEIAFLYPLRDSGILDGWFASWPTGIGLFGSLLAFQVARLLVSGAVYVVLRVNGTPHSALFLRRGQLDAPTEPVRWLGLREPEPWTRFGVNFAVIISAVTLAFLAIAGQPSLAQIARALPLLPLAMLTAACNSFNEEFPYRAALLSQTVAPLGKGQAMLLSAVLFGVAHYYGVPYGIVGMLMAGFLGWLMAKSVIETDGLFWAWLIHFLQDVLIYSFLAMGAVAPGGG